jgi:hypothetical protein
VLGLAIASSIIFAIVDSMSAILLRLSTRSRNITIAISRAASLIDATNNLGALGDKRGAKLTRLYVKLLLKLTHAGGEPIVRRLQSSRFVRVVDRPRRFERGDAE